MIGSDEFNFYRTSPAKSSASDANKTDYIETFLTASNRTERKSQLLIDIVCPQPRSQTHRSIPSNNQQPITRTARTNSTNGWRK